MRNAQRIIDRMFAVTFGSALSPLVLGVAALVSSDAASAKRPTIEKLGLDGKGLVA
jgi:hypothetical protein